jgi:hypothetical protein
LASAALIYYGQSRISKANFDRIQEGMTEDEVTAILGEAELMLDFTSSRIWEGAPGVIVVTFDEEGKVSAKGFTPRTVWERLRWSLDGCLEKLEQLREQG